MAVHRTIDYSEFDGLLAERAMADMHMTERHITILRGLLDQGVPPVALTSRMLTMFPGWEGRANAMLQICLYLQAGRRAEE